MKIFITGIQRGGTHFYSNYLAKKYKYRLIDEREFGYYNLKELNKIIIEDCVIQCPCLKSNVKEIKKLYPDSVIIWMYRDNEETLESMKSIGWKKSANQELCRLRESYNGKIIESENILESIIWTSLHLGLLNFKEGIIDRLINMRSLEHLNGFKKNKGVIGLC